MNKLVKETFGNIDIYLFDQILKERYTINDNILDSGCGKGRNISWFYHNKFNIYGLDKDSKSIEHIKNMYSNLKGNFTVSELDTIPFKDDFFNHIISNAVLHFAENHRSF